MHERSVVFVSNSTHMQIKKMHIFNLVLKFIKKLISKCKSYLTVAEQKAQCCFKLYLHYVSAIQKYKLVVEYSVTLFLLLVACCMQ